MSVGKSTAALWRFTSFCMMGTSITLERVDMQTATANLTSTALDWLVAKCLGEDEENTLDPLAWVHTAKPTGCWDYSTKWSQGGPIIEQEGIQLHVEEDRTEWMACRWGWQKQAYGPTPLIAAMRCFVVSKLGEITDVPEELMT